MNSPGLLPWLKCALSFQVFVTAWSCAQAQKPTELDRILEFSTPFTTAQSKFIHEGVTDQDPGAFVWIDPVAQEVLVRVHVELDREQLQSVVGQGGLLITYLGQPRQEVGSVRSAISNGTDAVPTYINTGDPGADNTRYELRKKSWIARHPGSRTLPVSDPE